MNKDYIDVGNPLDRTGSHSISQAKRTLGSIIVEEID